MKRIVVLAMAIAMVAVTMWCVVPAPDLVTLGFAVGIPELALSVLALFALVAIVLVVLARGRTRIAVFAICAIVIAPLLVPLAQAPGASSRTEALLAAHHIAALREHPATTIDETHDLPVKLRGGGELALDLYRPRVTGVPPLIVTIYGGAWHVGSRADDAPLARWYANRGYAVAVIDYRHAPAHRFPAQIDDVDDALNTIALHADGWRVDRERVALFGRSAGAQLALLAGERPQLVRVRAIVAYYAPSDLIRGWNEPPVPDPANVRAILASYLGGPPDARHRAVYLAAGPLQNAHTGMPPVLAMIGDRDELVRPEFQRAFASRLDALHVENIAIELPWANHAFDAVYGLGAQLARAVTLRFLDARL